MKALEALQMARRLRASLEALWVPEVSALIFWLHCTRLLLRGMRMPCAQHLQAPPWASLRS
jgi:hypothetical protein